MQVERERARERNSIRNDSAWDPRQGHVWGRKALCKLAMSDCVLCCRCVSLRRSRARRLPRCRTCKMRKSKAVGASLPAAAATREEEAVGGRGGEHIPVAEGSRGGGRGTGEQKGELPRRGLFPRNEEEVCEEVSEWRWFWISANVPLILPEGPCASSSILF